MRGIHREASRSSNGSWISPAHAGNTPPPRRCISTPWDQPRTCGEYRLGRRSLSRARGSAPHMRGIPLSLMISLYDLPDQPRTCGEYVLGHSTDSFLLGSAPHMRGIRQINSKWNPDSRISPAHAGNTETRGWTPATIEDQPRTCGEYCVPLRHPLCKGGSAPHMRGILAGDPVSGPVPGISPAHAGNTLAD